MIPVSTADQVRALDKQVIEHWGIEGRVLMEIAGQNAARHIAERFSPCRVAVLCGPGNNGGDGYVIARYLALWGFDVVLWASGEAKSPDARANRALCERMGLSFVGLEELGAAQLKIDALLGTGQDSAPRGTLAEGVAALHGAAPVVAVDFPTGVHANTGQALGEPATAALTVTLGRLKPGLLAMPGAALSGEVVVVDIGLGLADDGAQHTAMLLEESDVAAFLAEASRGNAKWDRGHVAIRAGGGAAVLVARGALAMGPGLVSVLAPREEWVRMKGLPPEVILGTPEDLDHKRHDVLVMGPGLGQQHDTEVRALWSGFSGPVVADADAISILAKEPASPKEGVQPRFITPHSAEAARLLGKQRDEIEADRFGAIRDLEPWGTAVLKGPCSLIGWRGDVWVNPTGGDRLATAGTGDVLAGMVGALAARDLRPHHAMCAAVWLHGRAGEGLPPRGTASDLLAVLRDLSWPG